MCVRMIPAIPSRPIVPHDEPQLQGAEPAAELDAVVHVIHCARILGGSQVFGNQREGPAQNFRPAGVERAQIDRREQPFVRIHHQRIAHARRRPGSLATREPPPPRRRKPRPRAATRRIPRPHRRPRSPDRCWRSTWCPRSERCRTASCRRAGPLPCASRSTSTRMRKASSTGILRMLSWPIPSVMPAFSTEECACSDVYITRPPALPRVRDSRIGHLARRRDSVQRADRRGVVDDSEEFRGQPDPLAQPSERHLFQFRQRGAAFPQHAVDVERRRQHLGENAGLRRRNREVGVESADDSNASARARWSCSKSSRMASMRFAVIGRVRRQPVDQVARLAWPASTGYWRMFSR